MTVRKVGRFPRSSRKPPLPVLVPLLLLVGAPLSACTASGHLEIVRMAEAPRFARSLRRSDARLLIATATDGRDTPSAIAVRHDTKLAADIRSLNLFSSVEVASHGIERWCEPMAKLTVTRIEDQWVDADRWLGNAAKAIFTLGTAASSLASRETLTSTVRLELQRWDGARRVYESRGEAVVERGVGRSSAAVQYRLTTRVTWAALKQLKADSDFHWVAVDRLKVTKPEVVAPARVARQVAESARPFPFETLSRIDDAIVCGKDICLDSYTRAGDGPTRSLSRVASPALGRYVVVADPDVPSIFSPSEIPVASRLVELSGPVALSDYAPFGFCEVVVYHPAKKTRTIYSSCDGPTWSARTELCHSPMMD